MHRLDPWRDPGARAIFAAIERRVPPERVFALLAAERDQPNADSVARAVAHVGPMEPYRRGQWWTNDFDTVRLPYALTGEAVRYYIDLVATFKRSGGRGVPIAPPMTGVSMRYVATVTRANSATAPGRPREGYVVDMELIWSNSCGNTCGLNFGKTRRVWVSPDGRVTAMEGDGVTHFVVS